MKPVGVFYATREGQTQRIAEHVAEYLRACGFTTTVVNVREEKAALDLGQCGAAIVAASVHAGKHEREMVKFVQRHRRELEEVPNAFLSVTLSEAGVEQAERTPAERVQFAAGVETVIREFLQETNWRPGHIRPVAGALRYSKYNPLVRFVMKRIARKAGASGDTSHDREYTDWLALDRFIEEFATELRSKNVRLVAG